MAICPHCNDEIDTVIRQNMGIVMAFVCPNCSKILTISPTESTVRYEL